MEIIKPSVMIVDDIDADKLLKKLELSGRKCWQSEPKGQSERRFVDTIIKREHTSVLEHVNITFDIICDRGVSHELVRHRIASFSQESTRYVNYNNKMKFIEPITLKKQPELYALWKSECEHSEQTYKQMIEMGAKPQEARTVLNHSVKTEVRVTMNIRSLRNFLSLRCNKAAHPSMKEIAIPLLLYLRERIPVVLDDIKYDKEFVWEFMDSEDYNYKHIVHNINELD